MPYNANVYKIMIVSPSDVASERNIIRSVINDWNVIHSEKYKLVLLPVGWDTHISPEMGESAQSYINKNILEDCDLLVGVFWTRVGTPTDKYHSGSIEEIEEHMKLGKPTMLYFSNEPVVPDSIDQDQYKKLIEFRESCKKRGIYYNYIDKNDLKDKFFKHLQIEFNKDNYKNIDIESLAIQDGNIINMHSNIPKLSREAQILLKEASQSYDGNILRIAFIGGFVIQTNEKVFGQGNMKEKAIWEGALKELEEEELIESQGYKREIFTLTRKGYDIAEQISI